MKDPKVAPDRKRSSLVGPVSWADLSLRLGCESLGKRARVCVCVCVSRWINAWRLKIKIRFLNVAARRAGQATGLVSPGLGQARRPHGLLCEQPTLRPSDDVDAREDPRVWSCGAPGICREATASHGQGHLEPPVTSRSGTGAQHTPPHPKPRCCWSCRQQRSHGRNNLFT